MPLSKPSQMFCWLIVLSSVVSLCLICSTIVSAQSTGGRILGRVADSSGAVLAGVKVTATNDATGAVRSVLTNDSGDYVLVEVQPATYTIQFELAGFKKNEQKEVKVDVNQVVTLNSALQIGGSQEVVEVSSEIAQVDTTSTQLGAVINERSVNELPLNTRDTYQFLQLQPGVQSQLGSSGSLFFGSDDPGSVSVNGGRTRANNFSVNGGDANDIFVNLPTIQPTPDSIAEFRVITNTFDAEYGRNSGSVVNVVTKTGSNGMHGNVYEYFRNTILDAQGFLNTTRPQLNQNQFGGTFGGAIRKDRTFFFASYEGRRIRSGQPGQLLNVPTTGQRNGDFSQIFDPTGTINQFTGSITDQFVADVLNGRPGCTSAIAAIPNSTLPVAGANWNQVFPTSVIPLACQDPVAVSLQRFIPAANEANSQNQSVPVGTNNATQVTLRFDHRINDHQNFTAYYYYNDAYVLTPYNTFEDAGASVPGFGSFNNSRNQQYNLSHTWTISNALVNEARFVYMREGQLGFLKNSSTGAVTSSCPGAAATYCFTGTSDSQAIQSTSGTSPSLGITPGLAPGFTGVPFVSIAGFASFGNNWEGQLPQVGNSFQWSDGLTWVKGNHTMKFGVDVRRGQFDQFYYYNVNGDYNFYGTGNDVIGGADGDYYPQYLLGLADNYSQGSGQSEAIRTFSIYPFVQDSWKIRPNLTLNYGLRWEFNTPPTDVSGHVETFRPGQNSTIYPCQLSTVSQAYFSAYLPAGVTPTCANTGTTPTGLVVPGDPGVPPGMTANYYHAFAPRIGLSYSPDNGKTSIRSGWGMFYNPIEQLVLAQFGAEPPFGGSTFLNNVYFNTPFVSQSGGVSPNPYNGVLTPKPGQPVDLSVFRPMLFYGEFQPNLKAQYTIQYNLTIQRQIANSLMLQVGYVGSEGHRLLVGRDINASNPQSCLDLYNISQYYSPNGPDPNPALQTAYGCGPTLEDSQWLLPANTIPAGYTVHLPYGPTSQVGPGNPQVDLVGLRPYSSPNCNPMTGTGCPVDGIPVFTSIFSEDTVANSNYNALEAMLEKRFSHGLQFQASYTWSKSMDEASTFEETLNPFNPKASRALSLFNSAQRFVISYDWELPVHHRKGFAGMMVNDWALSGITQFQSGFPIRLDTEDDYELINSLFFLGTEAPSMAGTLQKLNPKQPGQLYLNYNQFSDPPLGQFNNGTQRSVCCGPGLVDWDLSAQRKIMISESKYFQFRGEIFNLFNRTNFSNPDGHYQDGAGLFGKITQVGDPRVVQFALKFFF